MLGNDNFAIYYRCSKMKTMKSVAKWVDALNGLYQRHTTGFSIVLIVLFVLLSNATYIFITDPDPLISRSGLPTSSSGAVLNLPFAGGNSIEGNDGITKQALGVQANEQVFSWKLPLWNYYEGIGMPLLGETQSAALSPFTLLLSLPGGFLINAIVLELLSGIGAYLFIRRLVNKKNETVDNTIAIAGGCLYATIGVFMMMPSAGCNPIAFLPWSMLGVSLLFASGKKIFSARTITASLILTLSFVLSLSSGFPETAYINGILVLIFAIILFVKSKKDEKIPKLVSLVISGVVTVLISLPWLIEFLTFINPEYGHTGLHSSVVLDGIKDIPSAFLSSFIPHAIGFDESNPIFGSIGGVFTVSCVILALFAILSKNIPLWQKLLFGGWFLIGWLRVIGVPIVSMVMAHVPMLGAAAVYRYIPVSMSLALIILACLGLNEVVSRRKLNRKHFAIVLITIIIFYTLVLYAGRHLIKDFILSDPKLALFSVFFIELSVFASLAIFIAIFTKWKYKKLFICGVLLIESLLCFSVWQLGADPRGTTVDTRAVQYVQENIGTQRFESNILWPNYGSYFNISQLSMKDLPIPTVWYEYINENIDSYLSSIGFLSNKFDKQRIEQDKKLGVKYLVLKKNSLADIDSNIAKEEKLTLVYTDDNIDIFEIPGYRPYFDANGCYVEKSIGFDTFEVSCTKDTDITRLELYYPGWHAKVDGVEVTIRKDSGLFQQVSVSPGKHTIEYYYWPKHMTISLIGAGVGILTLIAGVVYLIIIRKRV